METRTKRLAEYEKCFVWIFVGMTVRTDKKYILIFVNLQTAFIS